MHDKIVLQQIDTTTQPETLTRVFEIYRESFPECERRPESSVMALATDTASPYTLMVVTDDRHNVLGLVSTWLLDGAVYVEHLAMSPDMRGNGLGGRVIDSVIASAHPLPVVLEVETGDTSAHAARRIGFYMRHGFNPHESFSYIQPPYAPGLPPVPLMLMSTAPIDLSDITCQLHHIVYGVD